MGIEPAEAIRVLLVDDDEDDYVITAHLLARQSRVQFAVEWEPNYARALLAIRESDCRSPATHTGAVVPAGAGSRRR